MCLPSFAPSLVPFSADNTFGKRTRRRGREREAARPREGGREGEGWKRNEDAEEEEEDTK